MSSTEKCCERLTHKFTTRAIRLYEINENHLSDYDEHLTIHKL